MPPRERYGGASFIPEAAVLRAGGVLSAHPRHGTRQRTCCGPACCRDAGGIKPRGVPGGKRRVAGGKRRVCCRRSRQGKAPGWCCISHGAQSNSYEFRGFGAALDAAETCPSPMPRGKTRAEAERPSNPRSCTGADEPHRPAQPHLDPAPLRNTSTRLHTERDP